MRPPRAAPRRAAPAAARPLPSRPFPSRGRAARAVARQAGPAAAAVGSLPPAASAPPPPGESPSQPAAAAPSRSRSAPARAARRVPAPREVPACSLRGIMTHPPPALRSRGLSSRAWQGHTDCHCVPSLPMLGTSPCAGSASLVLAPCFACRHPQSDAHLGSCKTNKQINKTRCQAAPRLWAQGHECGTRTLCKVI
jgi:hypothetical protein